MGLQEAPEKKTGEEGRKGRNRPVGSKDCRIASPKGGEIGSGEEGRL